MNNEKGYKCNTCIFNLCFNCSNRVFYTTKNKKLHGHDLYLMVRKNWRCNKCRKHYENKASFYCKKCDFVGDIAENLSENYKDNNELKFTVINIEKNKIRYVNEEDYKKVPSIFLFLKNKKNEPIKYNGKFDVKKLSKWIAVKVGWQEWDESVDEVYNNDEDDDNDYKKKYPFLNEDL